MNKRNVPTGAEYSSTSAFNVSLHDKEERFQSDNLEGALIEIDQHIDSVEEDVTALGGQIGDYDDEFIAIDGVISLPRYNDITFEATPTRINPATSKPDYDYTNQGFLFPQNDPSEAIHFTVQLNHLWKEGSAIYPHVHIRQANVAQCVFKVDYIWYNIGDTIPAQVTTLVLNQYAEGITYTSGTISQVVRSATPIAGTGKRISSFLKIKLYRDDNVYPGDVFLDQFDIHIELDSLGSRQEYIK